MSSGILDHIGFYVFSVSLVCPGLIASLASSVFLEDEQTLVFFKQFPMFTILFEFNARVNFQRASTKCVLKLVCRFPDSKSSKYKYFHKT
jgi:hypothetical protein